MRIGTTPTHYFDVDIDTSLIKTIKVTYKQCDEIVLVKRTEDCTIEKGRFYTTLSQEDTFKFKHDKLVYIQIRLVMFDGKCPSSDVIVKDPYECLDDEVLT